MKEAAEKNVNIMLVIHITDRYWLFHNYYPPIMCNTHVWRIEWITLRFAWLRVSMVTAR
jgi:hypothetical protein